MNHDVDFPKVPPLTWGHFFLWVLRRYHRYRVQGRSMLPTLREGDEVLIKAIQVGSGCFIKGDIVCCKDPRHSSRLMIKRVTQLSGSACYVEGDCAKDSTDSRHFGWIKTSDILGKVICFFSQNE